MHKVIARIALLLALFLITVGCHTPKPEPDHSVSLSLAEIESLRTNVIKWVNDSAKGAFYRPLETNAPVFVETTYIRIGDWQFNPVQNELSWSTDPRNPFGWQFSFKLTNGPSGWCIIETNTMEWLGH